ncbi:zinc finger Y-chromosomal protein-like [Aphomia sociella]
MEQSKESVPKSQRTPKTNQVTYMTEKKALIANVSTVLECSNVTPFKSKMRAGYPCFYCRNIFDNFQSLRTHQNEEHTKSNLRNLLKAYSAESLVVYADVTDLKCTLCDQNIINLQELKQHLTKYHDKRFYKKFTDRIVPFKFLENNYFECQICSLNLETFGAIERHMNTHYRNYACEECGAGFVTMLRLKTHMHSIHKEGHFPCNLCDKVFTTQQRYKGHVDFVHKMLKKLKCQKCPERFSDYFVQQKHLVEVHGETPIVYKCNVCDRSFNRRYTLSCHMKRRHLEQKDVECDLCSYACYNKTELRDHMLKHYMERSFQCSMCKKAYSRKKSLREHIIRIHANDKKFECKLCGQRFVHNCSLKAHIRNLHETE